jgi:hypothetical protein
MKITSIMTVLFLLLSTSAFAQTAETTSATETKIVVKKNSGFKKANTVTKVVNKKTKLKAKTACGMPAAPNTCKNFWNNYDNYSGNNTKCMKPGSDTSGEACTNIQNCWREAIDSGKYCNTICMIPGTPTQQQCNNFLANYNTPNFKPHLGRCSKPTTPSYPANCKRYSDCMKEAIDSREFCYP